MMKSQGKDKELELKESGENMNKTIPNTNKVMYSRVPYLNKKAIISFSSFPF